MTNEIDTMIGDLLEEIKEEGISGDDLRGLARLLKAVIGAGKGNAAKMLYKAMKIGDCVGDEYLFKILSKGLKRLGESEAAVEVDRDYAIWFQQQGGLL